MSLLSFPVKEQCHHGILMLLIYLDNSAEKVYFKSLKFRKIKLKLVFNKLNRQEGIFIYSDGFIILVLLLFLCLSWER